jgi:hypothetical protein
MDFNFAYLEIYWERIALKFEVPKKKAISIEKAWLTFRFCSSFYYQSNGDINKARTYIDKALEMSAEKPFYCGIRVARSYQACSAYGCGAASLPCSRRQGNAHFKKCAAE